MQYQILDQNTAQALYLTREPSSFTTEPSLRCNSYHSIESLYMGGQNHCGNAAAATISLVKLWHYHFTWPRSSLIHHNFSPNNLCDTWN